MRKLSFIALAALLFTAQIQPPAPPTPPAPNAPIFALNQPPCSGVVGNNIADDTAAINACEALRPVGSTLVWPTPPVAYVLSSPVTATKAGAWNLQGVTINSTLGPLYLSASNFTLNGGKSTFNYTSTNPSFNRAVRLNPTGLYTINGTGATGSYPVTSGNVAIGATSFPARSQDAAILSPGDWIEMIYDDAGGYPQSEIKQVVSVTGGTTVNINVPFAQAFNNSAIGKLGAITAGSGYNGFGSATFLNVPLTGGTGTGATAYIVVTAGAVTAIAPANLGSGYTINDVLSASNANLGGSGSGFSIPVTGLWVPGWVKFLTVIQNTEVNNLNINYTSAVQVIGIDTQPGAMNSVIRDNVITINSPLGLGFFGSQSFNPQYLNNIINGIGTRSSEISAIQGGLVKGNKFYAPQGGTSGGLSLNSGAFGTVVTENKFDGSTGSAVSNLNDVAGVIYAHNTHVCGAASIGTFIVGGNNNLVASNDYAGCIEGVDVADDHGTFVGGTWGAQNNVIAETVVRNATNAIHTSAGSLGTASINLSTDNSVTTSTIFGGIGESSSFIKNGQWGFVGRLTVNGTDGSTIGLIAGSTRGVRFGADATASYIQGVDNTATAFQPLTIGGGAATNFTGVLNLGAVSGAGVSAGKTLCVDAANNVLIKVGAC